MEATMLFWVLLDLFALLQVGLIHCVKENHEDKKDMHQTDVTKQIEEMFRHHSYELSIKPPNNGQPILVNVSIMIESITDISEKNMDLTFTLCLHQAWIDQRLRFVSEKNDSIVMPSRLLQKIWVPDLYIVGSKSSFIHRTTVDNTVLRLFRDGRIVYSIKLTSTVACQMSLKNFPFDKEYCTLTLSSLGHNSKEILLQWKMDKKDAIFLRPELLTTMPKFLLTDFNFTSNQQYTNENKVFRGFSQPVPCCDGWACTLCCGVPTIQSRQFEAEFSENYRPQNLASFYLSSDIKDFTTFTNLILGAQ